MYSIIYKLNHHLTGKITFVDGNTQLKSYLVFVNSRGFACEIQDLPGKIFISAVSILRFAA